MIYSVLLAIGDSLTNGARDPLGKSWPQYLAEEYFQRFKQPLLFVNESVNGEIIATACRRFYPLLKSNPEAHEVVFFEGTNDAKPTVQTPLEDYKQSLLYVVNTARSLGRCLYLPTLPGLSGFGAPDYDKGTNTFIVKYNGIIRSVAAQFKLPLIELTSMQKYPYFYTDGVHLSEEGNRHIAGLLADAIAQRRLYDNGEE